MDVLRTSHLEQPQPTIGVTTMAMYKVHWDRWLFLPQWECQEFPVQYPGQQWPTKWIFCSSSRVEPSKKPISHSISRVGAQTTTEEKQQDLFPKPREASALSSTVGIWGQSRIHSPLPTQISDSLFFYSNTCMREPVKSLGEQWHWSYRVEVTKTSSFPNFTLNDTG